MEQNNQQPLEQETESLLEETPVEETEVLSEEAPVEESEAAAEPFAQPEVETETPVAELAMATEKTALPEDKKKTPIAALVVAIVALLALIGVCIWLLVSSSNKQADEGEPTTAANSESGDPGMTDGVSEVPSGTYSYTDESLVEEYNKQVVATLGNHELTNAMLQIFFWDSYSNFLNNNSDYISYLGLDTSVSLSQQAYGEEQTWEEYFVEEAIEMFRQYCTLADCADAAGLTLTDEMKSSLDSLGDTVEEYATEYGYESGEEYLADLYGPGITLEDVKAHRELYFKAVVYVQSLNEGVEATDEEISQYYDDNEETYTSSGITKVDKNVVNVRHILFEPEYDVDSDGDGTDDECSEDSWGTAEAAAKDALMEWEEDPTEENFGTMAEVYSADTGSSSNGGLYEGLYPGKTVTEFNDWCFDDQRQPGDYGIIKTEYGYHIMYYVSEGDYIYWKETAKEDYLNSLLDAKLNAALEGITVEPDYSKVHIFDLIQQYADESSASATTEE